MKFILFVEGHTEHQAIAAFLKRWLDPRLNLPAGVQPVRFDGWSEMVRDMPKKAQIYLEAPKGDVIAVIALLDIYGMQLLYPKEISSVEERFDWAKKHLQGEVNHSKFHQFFAVHETEAWLLSEPKLFPTEIAKILKGKAEKPETVNHDEPPAKLLEHLYISKTGHGYKKVTEARNLFPILDPDIAYEKCPYLKMLLDEMLALAKAAGL